MENNMTVFGFGRQYRCCDRYLTAVPAKLTIGFAETKQFPEILKIVESTLQPLDINISNIEKSVVDH
jgi:hypothetical protein